MVRQTRQGPSARHKLMQGVARAIESYWQDSAPALRDQGRQQALGEPAAQPGL
jgi:hypothetical protein